MNQPTKKSLTNKQILETLVERLDNIEEHMPNGEMVVIINHIETIMDKQNKMYEDLSEMKKTLLNPDNGVIVRVNKNTEFRVEQEEKERDFDKLFREHYQLMTFKSNITRFLWLILSTITASIVMLWTKIFNS